MPNPYKRADRVGELILENVSEIVRRLSNLNSGLITVMSVKISDDLLSCRVFYSVLGSHDAKNKAEVFFEENAKEIRHQIAAKLDLRRVPSFTFTYDDTNEKASKIYDILKKIENEKK
ncbi:MAG: 30S ribosome-binding factor RbfA [Elusimicrobiota bacterium]|jgi:ribosome-binding factor A|nr:30S ribosome-binding factor RbfA [Elusimicrobiota bacterium]